MGHFPFIYLTIKENKMQEKTVIVGAGVAGVNAATKLIDNNYKGKITIIDMGKSPHERLPEEVMTGFLGAGGWSDGKLTYHTSIGGQLSKYCGEDKAMKLFDEVIANFKRFHPNPSEVQCSDPQAEPDFIKPYFGLRLFPVWHVGTDYLHEIGKNWYNFLIDNDVEFIWETKVTDIDFDNQLVSLGVVDEIKYDKLIFGVGKSGIDFGKKLAEKYELPTEPKSVQIGVRFEAPQHHFQKLIDVSYDFKLYQKFEDKGVSLRSFCTNNNAAYVAVEDTYGNHSYNGHAKKDEAFRNDMTNFGILMEIKGIDKPFDWSREAVKKLQVNETGTYFSPSKRIPSKTSEGGYVKCVVVDSMDSLYDAIGDYALHIESFIEDMKKIFPTLGNDWGIYMPEVKYLSPEPLVKYDDLSLTRFPNVHFVGDALSARGITVSGAQGTYVAESILKEKKVKKVNLRTYGKSTTRDMKLTREESDGSKTTAHVLQIEGVAKFHNWEGPAVINKQQKVKDYYLSGIKYTRDDWGEMRKHRDGLPPSKRSAPKGYTNRS